MDDNIPESPEVRNEREARAANDGYVAGVGFARWYLPGDHSEGTPSLLLVRSLMEMYGGPDKTPEPIREFFAGFLAGAEAERSGEDHPFAIEWIDDFDPAWHDLPD
jgi:hypothetical protein